MGTEELAREDKIDKEWMQMREEMIKMNTKKL